jgi:hypothetical protein
MKVTCGNCGLEQNVDRGGGAGQEPARCSQCGAVLQARPKGSNEGINTAPDGHVSDH